MGSDPFRQQLREESQAWCREGLISTEVREQLAQRYRFDQLDQEASRQFLNILLGLGGILLGLGAITFVAANWQGMAPWLKVLLLGGSLVLANVFGFGLWNDATSPSKQRWGHGLLLLGVLLLGANIGLLPQIFHQSGPVYGLFMVWGLAVLLMAAGLRLASLAIAALILLMIAYFTGQASSITGWGLNPGLNPGLNNGLDWIIPWMPLVIVVWFLPLAHWCRSRWLFGLGAIVLGWTLFSNGMFFTAWLPAWLTHGLALFLPGALLWSYDGEAWCFSRGRFGQIARSSPTDQGKANSGREGRGALDPLQASFRSIARAVALIALALSLYYLSFHGIPFWDAPDQIQAVGGGGLTRNGIPFPWLHLVDELLLIVLAKLGWFALLKQWPGFNQFQLRSLNSGMVALLISLPVALLIWTGLIGPLPITGPFIINVLLALMAIGLIRDGLALGLRSCFWLGMALLVIDIITRTFEYDAGLMVKALAFMLCGVAVLIAGVWFEKKSQARLTAAPTSNPT